MKCANLCSAIQKRILTAPNAVTRFQLHNHIRRSKSSYVHCPGMLPLSGATVGQLIRTAAEKWPKKEALISAHQEVRFTFQDVHTKSDQLAVSFIRLGMKPGDRIGIWATNCAEWYLTQMAAAKAGLLLVTINPLYEANELRECLRKVQARALVYGDKVRNRRMHDILAQVAPDLEKRGDGEVTTWHVDSLKNCIAIGADPHKVSVRFDDLLVKDASNAELANIEENIQPDDACNVQFTSGTTGTPKAAVLSHHNIVNNSFLIGSRFNLEKTGSGSICMPNPLFHAFGCVIGTLVALSHGIKLVMPSPLPNAKDTLKALKTEKCSIVYGTPTMHIDLLNEMAAQDTTKSDINVKVAVTAGAFCPAEIYRRIRQNLADFVYTCYGMTECSPVNFQSSQNDDEDTLDVTVGKLCDHWEAKVVDCKGKAVPFGNPGELWVRGYGTMLGYWQDANANANTLTPDGWLKTGDQFVLDERGYGKVVGRIKELIIRGGENIYPGEVEDVLQTHPSVDEAQRLSEQHKWKASMSLRSEVINLYKTLLHLGRDYPQGYDYFRRRLKTAFFKNKDEIDPEKIKVMIARGNFVVKEIEALYMLRKYRTLKNRYYGEQGDKVVLAPGQNLS